MLSKSDVLCRYFGVLANIMLVFLTGCGENEIEIDRPDGWTEVTHDKSASPNYDLLFKADQVHSIDIVITSSNFDKMQADLSQILNDGGEGNNMAELPKLIAACVGLAENDPCKVTLQQTLDGTCRSIVGSLACIPAGHKPDGQIAENSNVMKMVTRDPIYIPVEVRHDGHIWNHVGMRYKGNSSLAMSARRGNGKLPFRLQFDKYENEFPEIEDQRFYGFKELTFSSNWSDDSQIREMFVSELLRDRGIPAARCAFYRVTVDVGNGPVYWGLYSAIEDPSDKAMLDSQIGNHNGNIYKPEGKGADWTVFDSAGFIKKNNDKKADWSDIEAAISALLADQTDQASWRANLESKFDVDGFLRWLAVNTAILNWDSYGSMAHNYYLYGDSARNGQLRWIPWDHNLAMMESAGLFMGGNGKDIPEPIKEDAFTEIFHTHAGPNWPLISRILANSIYQQRYRVLLSDALGGLFNLENAAARMHELHNLIKPHIIGSNGENPGHMTISSADAFLQSIDGEQGLIAHIANRRARVMEALTKQ